MLAINPEQLGIIARIRQRDAMKVMRDVEVGVIHPFRCTEVERVSMQHLGAARDALRPFGERRHQIAVVGRRPIHDRHASDRQAHMGIGILGLQKTRVQHREVLHAVTMRFALVVAAGPQVLNPQAQRRAD